MSRGQWHLAVIAMGLILAAATPSATWAQGTNLIAAQGALDGITRALMDASPTPGGAIVTRIVDSDLYLARVTGTEATVTTRFLAESPRDVVAAALARDLFPDPVLAAIVLRRAGFNGPAGFGQLHDRLWVRLNAEAQYLAAVQSAYADLQGTIAVHGFSVWVPEGFQVMAAARIREAEQAYQQAAQAYQDFLVDRGRFFAMTPVPASLVEAVIEVNAVLDGARSIESSPLGPRIRAAQELYAPTPAAPR